MISPEKRRTPKSFTIANFGHPVLKSWLRPWKHRMIGMILGCIVRERRRDDPGNQPDNEILAIKEISGLLSD